MQNTISEDVSTGILDFLVSFYDISYSILTDA